jgi:hypothetical protein
MCKLLPSGTLKEAKSFVYLLRTNEIHPYRKLNSYKPEATRTERPSRRWLGSIEEDLQITGIYERSAGYEPMEVLSSSPSLGFNTTGENHFLTFNETMMSFVSTNNYFWHIFSNHKAVSNYQL